MKKILIIPVIFVIICFMSCEEPKDNPFVGTWKHENGQRFVFTSNILTNYKPNNDIYWKGTYTYNETHIITQWSYIAPELEDSGYLIGEHTMLYEFVDNGFITSGELFQKVN